MGQSTANESLAAILAEFANETGRNLERFRPVKLGSILDRIRIDGIKGTTIWGWEISVSDLLVLPKASSVQRDRHP